jgi:transposase
VRVKKYTDECKEMEIPIDPEKVREFEEIYDAIIQEGIEENPPPDNLLTDQVKKRGRDGTNKSKESP